MLAPDDEARTLDVLRLSLASDIIELIVLTTDEGFLKTLREAVGPARRLWHVPLAAHVSDLLIAGGVGILVLDVQGLLEPPLPFIEQTKRQFPDLVIVVAGVRETEGELAALISEGIVYRFIHKPVSPNRARLFADAAVRRHAAIGLRKHQAALARPAQRPPKRWPRWEIVVACVFALVVVAGTVLWVRHPPATSGVPASTAPAVSGGNPSGGASGGEASLTGEAAGSPATSLAAGAAPIPASPATSRTPASPGPGSAESPLMQQLGRAFAESHRSNPPPLAPTVSRTPELGTEAMAAPSSRQRGAAAEAGNAAAAPIATTGPQTPLSGMTRPAEPDLPAGAETAPAAAPVAAPAGPMLATPATSASPSATPPAGASPSGGMTALPGPSASPPAGASSSLPTGPSSEPSPGAPSGPGAVIAAVGLRLMTSAQPIYPLKARVQGLQGWVELQFIVDERGQVRDPHVIGAQPAGVFEEAAIAAVRQWRYAPVLREGRPVAQAARLRVRFSLDR